MIGSPPFTNHEVKGHLEVVLKPQVLEAWDDPPSFHTHLTKDSLNDLKLIWRRLKHRDPKNNVWGTPTKLNMEPKRGPLGNGKTSTQTMIFWGSMLIFLGDGTNFESLHSGNLT